jgi:hypothetical protein
MKILKGTIVIVSFFLLSLGANAQSIAIGLKGGLNFANLNGATASEVYSNRTGYHFGAFTLIKFGKIGIQPEIVYSKQGSTVTVNAQNFDSNFDYFNIPIILKLYTVAGINIQVGPQFGFISGAKYPISSGQGSQSLQDITNQLKGSDVSVAMGLGWDLPFGLSVDGRYNLGVSKANNTSSIPDIKNQVFQLSIGYKIFKLGK